ncbi:hypothetical protein ACHAWT_002484 [Skeletonema menzelii]|mmetsp:Transcript_697/g.1149  ORF Transcript_697/g.1149 Transcript_697/m.1149 type:complete len:354 (-) Transcript_697:21-1082(-)
MSLMNSSGIPEEKTLLIESPAKRDKEATSTPSNVYLLNVAFYSFALFALGQMFVAVLVAKSQAMVGDSSAMVIDSLTYLFNSYAEKIKNKSLKESVDDNLSAAEKELRRLERTRQRLWLEILPPLCSVMTLIVLTIYIIIDAYNTLTGPYYEDGENEEPNIGVMFFFSALNLGLDIMNVTCFARAKHAFGFAVIDKDRHRYVLAYDGSLHNEMADSMKREQSEVDFAGLQTDQEDNSPENYCSISEDKKSDAAHILPSVEEEEKSDDINLNMCSAYTHVFADTLRSTAVLIAAGLSYCLNVGEPPFVDAVAALAVSIIILLSLGPLLNGIIHAAEQLKQLSKLKNTRFSQVSV